MIRTTILWVCLTGLPSLSMAAFEDFASALWQHHEELPVQVMTDDLIISVPAGASIKGVTSPNALQPGFDPLRPARTLIIEPRNTTYLDLLALAATDLFQMPTPQIKVVGFRGGMEIASTVMGPLWDDVNNNGIVQLFTGFNGLERIEISSDVALVDDSDVFFFLDGISYEAKDTLTGSGGASTIIEDDDDSGGLFGSGFGLLWVLAAMMPLLGRRRALLKRD